MRNVVMPNNRGDFQYCHLSSSKSQFMQYILSTKYRSFMAVLIHCVVSQWQIIHEIKILILFPQIFLFSGSLNIVCPVVTCTGHFPVYPIDQFGIILTAYRSLFLSYNI